MLDSADTIAAFAADMSEFLKTSELTETRSFMSSFVKEIAVGPGKATIRYAIPMPQDSPIGESGRRGGRPQRASSQYGTSWYPWRDSNSRTRLRRPVLYPLSYRGRNAPNANTREPGRQGGRSGKAHSLAPETPQDGAWNGRHYNSPSSPLRRTFDAL